MPAALGLQRLFLGLSWDIADKQLNNWSYRPDKPCPAVKVILRCGPRSSGPWGNQIPNTLQATENKQHLAASPSATRPSCHTIMVGKSVFTPLQLGNWMITEVAAFPNSEHAQAPTDFRLCDRSAFRGRRFAPQPHLSFVWLRSANKIQPMRNRL